MCTKKQATACGVGNLNAERGQGRAGQDCGGTEAGTEAETGEERGADNGTDRHYC